MDELPSENQKEEQKDTPIDFRRSGVKKKSVRKLLSSNSETDLLALVKNSNQPKQESKIRKIRDYQILRNLGKGAYGKVYLGKKEGEEKLVALKILDKYFLTHNDKINEVFIEKTTLLMCHHPGIIQFISSFQTKSKLVFILEYCPNGDLEFFLKKFGILSMDVAKIYAAEIINILDYLHNNIHLSHRDLKPSNLMLDEDFHLKLVRNIFFIFRLIFLQQQ